MPKSYRPEVASFNHVLNPGQGRNEHGISEGSMSIGYGGLMVHHQPFQTMITGITYSLNHAAHLQFV
jgi:hypothetical protein